MVLYHITDKEYQPGQIVNINDFASDSIYHQGLQEYQKKINICLSDNRPEGEPSRQFCLYAFEKPEYCVYFKKKEIIAGQPMHLYKCKMFSLQGHPMILVHQFEVLTEDKWSQLITEYWHPTRRWNLMEHLAEELEIIEEIPITCTLRVSSFMIGNNDYADDSVKARLFNSVDDTA